MFLLVANQMAIMFILIVIGFFIRKKGIVDHEGSKVMSDLLLLVINPMLVLNSFLTLEYDPARTKGFLLAMALSILAHFLGIIAARILLPGKGADVNIERYSAAYSNCGFMGIPVVNSMLGAEGVFYLTAFIIVFQVFIWTHGIGLIRGNLSLKQVVKGLCAPVVITVYIGLACYFLKLRVPHAITGATSYVASMNTAMAMFIAGVALAESNIFSAIKKFRTYIVSLTKLFVVPLLIIAVMLIIRPAPPIFYAIVAAAASPSATTCTMMAVRYNSNYRYASELFAVTTLLSILSIPAVVAIAEMLY